MKSRIPFGLLMMLTALVMSLIPAATISTQSAQALSTCDSAQFVADVTVPDNTLINPGATFIKTWRLKNTGVCQWTTSYQLVFASGIKMSGPDSVAFPKAVLPGQTVDLSVTLIAPNASGTLRGNWQLKNGAGGLFGIGVSHSNPFWVQIKVVSPTQNITAYDFVANMCSAQWSYDGGPIPCPINVNKLLFGYVQTVAHPVLEDGTTSSFPALLTIPQSKYNSLIRGSFPVADILRGDHFQALIGCQFNAVNCYVTFEVGYQVGDSLFTLWKSKEKYDGLMTQADVDLTRIANLKANLVLTILSTGPFEGDQPLWVNPRIVRAAAVPITTPTPIPPTATPTSVGPTAVPTTTTLCDKAQFISDITVPDGTVFTPGTPFTKTWRLKNVGTCTWTTAYSLVFASGERMSGADLPLPVTVTPGQIVDLSVNLIAPAQIGSYRSYWQFKNAGGALFGIGSNGLSPFFADIKVAGTSTATPTRTGVPATNTPTSTPTGTSVPATGTPTFTPTRTTVPATATPTRTTAPATPTATSSTTANWSTYQNVKYGFFFKFPPGSTLSNQTDNGGHLDLPILVSGTNLLQKTLDVGVAEGVSPCKSPVSNPSIPPTNVTFNGIQFLKETYSIGATSHVGDFTAYSTAKGTACITLTFMLYSVVPGVITTPPPVYDPVAESAVFSTIMSTYGNQ